MDEWPQLSYSYHSGPGSAAADDDDDEYIEYKAETTHAPLLVVTYLLYLIFSYYTLIV